MNERFDFDELSRAMAQGLSRRAALRRLGGGFAGALLASLGLGTAWAKPGQGGGGGGSSFERCNDYCRTLPRPQRANCNEACKQCGGNVQNVCPSQNSAQVVCCERGTCCQSGLCTETDVENDINNCGACGNQCTGGKICNNGTCECPVDRAACGDVCCGPSRTCTGEQCVCEGNRTCGTGCCPATHPVCEGLPEGHACCPEGSGVCINPV